MKRIEELEAALRACVNIANHPLSTKADMRHIAKDGERILNRNVQPSEEQEAMQQAFDALTSVTVRTREEGEVLQSAAKALREALDTLKP